MMGIKLGQKHRPLNEKIQALAFHLAGLSATEVERRTGVPHSCIYDYRDNPKIRQEAEAVVQLAREDAERRALIAAGWVIGKDGRRFSPASIKKISDAAKALHERFTPEERRAQALHRTAHMTFEERSAKSKAAALKLTPEQRSERSKRAAQKMTPEQRSERGKKVAAARAANRAARDHS